MPKKGYKQTEEHRINISKSNMGKNKGRKASEETKRKMSKARKGKTLPKEHCRRISEAKMGHEVSVETRQKIKNTLRGVHTSPSTEFKKGQTCGENNHRWNPNLTDEDRIINRAHPEYSEWRKAVYDRDDYICQRCGKNASGHLNAHHIESYDNNPDLRTKVSNGITLCEDCHNDFHHQYGRGSNTREQFEKFMS